jgi:S-adenosylmethionine synthetase
MVTTQGTGKVSDEKLSELVQKHFDLRPKGIIQMLLRAGAPQRNTTSS